jgi:TPR repeat protein
MNPDNPQVRELYDKSCQGGYLNGCASFGSALVAGIGGPPDIKRGIAVLEHNCKENPVGCRELGIVYDDPDFGATNKVRARQLFARACEGNDGWGCEYYGQYLGKGIGGPKDQPKARTLHEKACDLDIYFACVSLGEMLANGWGGEADYAKAQEVLDRACKGGDERGCKGLAILRDLLSPLMK